MEKNWRDQKKSKGYYFIAPTQPRSLGLKVGETTIAWRGGVIEISSKSCSQRTIEIKYSNAKDWLWRENQNSCWYCKTRKAWSKGLYAYSKIIRISKE
jgi:hypothetical protein